MASAGGTSTDGPHIVPSSSGMPEDPPTPNNPAQGDLETPRGRLKRRRVLSHSPPRAPSPSRGHDRDSGSRHRHHHRKQHRASSSRSVQQSTSPPQFAAVKKHRRRSDAEPDHTLRGRARNRSGSRSRSPILEGQDEERDCVRGARRRSQPPSRGRVGDAGDEGVDQDGGEMRRQRSFPNLYKDGRNKSKGTQDSGAEARICSV